MAYQQDRQRGAEEDVTIAAVATPTGQGGVGIVRISGSRVPEIAAALLGSLPPPRRAVTRTFRDAQGETIDSGLALYFAAPASFTGEDVLELHGHGGPVVMDMVLKRALELGARLAEPGEFTRRAFLNDKLDLAQAEAVADLIASGSEQAARAALRSLRGDFSRTVHELTEAVIETRLHVEAAIDFPEEEIDFLSDPILRGRIENAASLCGDIIAKATQGALLRDGMTVVIAGRPNAGKSSLLNRLAGYEAAIVTDIPGTTRDVLRERIDIDGMPLNIADTAGLREEADVVEAEGIRRAHAEIGRADRVLYLIDATRLLSATQIDEEIATLSSAAAITVVINKIDLAPGAAVNVAHASIAISVATGEGLAALREHLKACMGFQSPDLGTISARRRHLDALKRAMTHLETAQQLLLERRAGELMAEELRQAQQHLGEITGEFTSDDLLGRIFSAFCIGK